MVLVGIVVVGPVKNGGSLNRSRIFRDIHKSPEPTVSLLHNTCNIFRERGLALLSYSNLFGKQLKPHANGYWQILPQPETSYEEEKKIERVVDGLTPWTRLHDKKYAEVF